MQMKCPKCGSTTQTPSPIRGQINCGDCLLDNAKVVPMVPLTSNPTESKDARKPQA